MRKFINKIVNVPKLVFRLWITLWLTLIILLILKFCFGIWYPIVINNEWFIKINTIIIQYCKYLLLSMFYTINLNVLYLISCRKFWYSKWYEAITINILIQISFCIKMYSRALGILPELIILIFIPLFYLLKTHKSNPVKIILYPIIMQIFIAIWQLNIYLVRGINFDIASDEHILIGIILQLDYYIFTIITWIGVTKMSLFGAWFFGKDVTTLKAEREKELAKANSDTALIEKLDASIKELEEQGE